MAEELLDVSVSHRDGVALLIVRGDIDAHSVTVLRAALEQLDSHTTVLVDMADVAFIDSSGIGEILAHTLRMEQGHGSIQVVQPSAAVRRVVEITGLEAAFYETRTNKALGSENHHLNSNNPTSTDASHRSDAKGSVDQDVA